MRQLGLKFITISIVLTLAGNVLAESPPITKEQARQYINQLTATGLITEVRQTNDPQVRFVFVTRDWYNLTMQAKRSLGNCLAIAYPGQIMSVIDVYTEKHVMTVVGLGIVNVHR
jgi:hypothetical protein